jgi:putative ABC transport system permease protein
MNIDVADQIRDLDGVAAAAPEVQMIFDPEANAFGGAQTIVGLVAGSDEGNETFELRPALGRLLTADDEGELRIVLGSDMARQQKAGIGDTIEMRGEQFEVVGILEPTLTAPDTSVFVPLEAAQVLFHKTLPAAVQEAIPAKELISQVVVFPESGTDPAALAALIKERVDNTKTLTGAEFNEQVGSATAIFNAIIIGVAIISLVVGGLSVINTMAMSVAERTREIGIKRAIGGSRRRIIRELVTEAAVIGLIGGLIGLGLGALVVVLANEAGRDSGTILFDLTPGTATFAVAFSTILGMVAGVIPAWSAARLDPVEALRYE